MGTVEFFSGIKQPERDILLFLTFHSLCYSSDKTEYLTTSSNLLNFKYYLYALVLMKIKFFVKFKYIPNHGNRIEIIFMELLHSIHITIVCIKRTRLISSGVI
jgi:hypothetical protein